MGIFPVSTGGTGVKRLAELNYHMRYEHKVVRDGFGGEGQGLSEEDESRINEVGVGVTESNEELVRARVGLVQEQPKQPQIRWERFLPLRSLKVLLVENDDSTRHIVSALLRNCSYEVTAVANGLHAWKFLQDLTGDIDLVLSEVVMPCLSGIDLLCKIMSDKTYKNIPVIMMSSHDSKGVIFKCLSNGAVDFLLKPIRKNELKNLWQHVWRRCHSSCSSASESGIQTQKSAKSKCVDGYENNTGSNSDHYNGNVALNVMDGSDNGSGTQSNWTKRSVEVNSPQPMSPWDQVADPPYGTCALVIHSKPDAFSNEWGPIAAKGEFKEQDENLLENVAMGKDLDIGVPGNSDLKYEYPCQKICTNLMGTQRDKLPELSSDKYSGGPSKGILDLNSRKPGGELRTQAADYIGSVTNRRNACVESRVSEVPNDLSKVLEVKDKATSDAKELPSLGLSLNRLIGTREVGNTTHDERNVLRHSHLSAFLRYNTASTANKAPIENVESCSPLDNSSEVMKTESMYNQWSNGSNNNDMGSTTKNVLNKPAAFNEKSAILSTSRCLNHSAFQPLQNGRTCPSVQIIPQKTNDAVVNTVVVQPRDVHKQVQVQCHHLRNMQKQLPPPDQDHSLLNMAAPALQCGASNLFARPIEVNSLNESASGSNHGVAGISKNLNSLSTYIESGNRVAGKSGIGGSSGSGSGVDQNRFAQRVAALTKFRQKRRDRCFQKKVRYQSRKRLAEQRPRDRGQFVRQRLHVNTRAEAEC